jgi:uncharacterized protein (TIGR00159 family)
MLGKPGFLKKRNRFLFWRFDISSHVELDIDKVIMACKKMAESKTGALIIIANKSALEQYAASGELINANISESLIENIFFKNSPLHDGAMIIHQNKIKSARSILPVSNNPVIPAVLGLRHRAAVGVTEQSDAQSIVVSEETGNIAYSVGGKLQTKVKPNQLKSLILENLS